ncbi:hypothetical protein NDI52_28445 [Leptolyngbya sp. PL-A3]|uniref:hypothetical protein n=1 Tax=Leptolyngbya sp. PL-A3 TaxID=2933911 RepID=UPI0032999B4E
MQDNKAEIRLRAQMLVICSGLNKKDAEHLAQITNGDEALLDECLQLLGKGINIAFVAEWLNAKTGITQVGSPTYKFCEAVLNLAMGSDRQRPQ